MITPAKQPLKQVFQISVDKDEVEEKKEESPHQDHERTNSNIFNMESVQSELSLNGVHKKQ